MPTDPEFCQGFKAKVALPGAAQLCVRVCAHRETITSEGVRTTDDTLGETHVDVEQRWFSERWRALPLKPIEHRALWHPACGTPVGYLSLWVDIHPVREAKRLPPVDAVSLRAITAETYEVRLVLWKTRDVQPQEDDPTGLIDLFLEASLGPGKKQSTDTHWFSTGDAEFNWRMIWPIFLPEKVPRLFIQVRRPSPSP